MDLSPEKIRWILVYLFVLLISVAIHEFGHAIVAHKLGDDTPSRQGRVTLNPLAHADLIGTFLLPLAGAMLGGGGFGWGKPVQWQPHRITRRVSMSTAKILVAVAGPAMNLVLGTVLVVIHVVLIKTGVLTNLAISQYLVFAVETNYLLFFFNLLPLPPLDGGHIAQSFVPFRHREAFDSIAKFGPFLLLGFLMVPGIGRIVSWPAEHLANLVYGLFPR
jgi:Zn-dependent protease